MVKFFGVLSFLSIFSDGLCGSSTYFITTITQFSSTSDSNSPPSAPPCLDQIPGVSGRSLDDTWGGRIIGGALASEGQFPHVVSFRTSNNNRHFCGGFIITKRWIGSAAHCFPSVSTKDKIAVVGTISLLSGGTFYALKLIIKRSDYVRSTISNDVAMVKTSVDIQFNDNIGPIPLSAGYTGGDSNVVVAGFGKTSDSSKISNDLLFVGLRTITNDQCRAIFAPQHAKNIFDGSLCVYDKPSGGVCQGDSGGALVANGEAVGIVSWAVDCSQYPDVSARISVYRGWMMKQIELF